MSDTYHDLTAPNTQRVSNTLRWFVCTLTLRLSCNAIVVCVGKYRKQVMVKAYTSKCSTSNFELLAADSIAMHVFMPVSVKVLK